MRRAALLFLGFVVAACGGEPDYPPTSEGLYLRHCSRCHEEDGSSATATRLAKARVDLRDPRLHAELSDAAIAHVIEFGQGRMQGVANLMPAEVDSIVLHVRRLRAPGGR